MYVHQSSSLTSTGFTSVVLRDGILLINILPSKLGLGLFCWYPGLAAWVYSRRFLEARIYSHRWRGVAPSMKALSTPGGVPFVLETLELLPSLIPLSHRGEENIE